MEEETPAAAPVQRKGGATKEQQVINALSDKALRGHEEAIYYMLRSMGMEVTQPPPPRKKLEGDEESPTSDSSPKSMPLPKIEVSAIKQPTLFAALRRLGIKAEGKKMFVEPKSSQERAATAAPAYAGNASMQTSASSPAMRMGPSVDSRPYTVGNMASTGGSSAFIKSKNVRALGGPYKANPSKPRKVTENELADFYRRQGRPKHAQCGPHVLGTIEICNDEIVKENIAAEKKAKRDAEEAARLAYEEEKKRMRAQALASKQSNAEEGAPAPAPAPAPAASPLDKIQMPSRMPSKMAPPPPVVKNDYEEATGPPDWWRIKPANQKTRKEQIEQDFRNAKPNQRRVRTYFPMMAEMCVGPMATVKRPPPNKKAILAANHLQERLAKIKEMGGYPWQRSASAHAGLDGQGDDFDYMSEEALRTHFQGSRDSSSKQKDPAAPYVDWSGAPGRSASEIDRGIVGGGAFEQPLSEVQAAFGGRGCCSTPGGASDGAFSSFSEVSSRQGHMGWQMTRGDTPGFRRSGGPMRSGSCPTLF